MRQQKAAAAAAAGPEMVCPSCGYGAPPAAAEEPAEAVSDGNESEPEEVRPGCSACACTGAMRAVLRAALTHVRLLQEPAAALAPAPAMFWVSTSGNCGGLLGKLLGAK